jgi:hypothetical protein
MSWSNYGVVREGEGSNPSTRTWLSMSNYRDYWTPHLFLFRQLWRVRTMSTDRKWSRLRKQNGRPDPGGLVDQFPSDLRFGFRNKLLLAILVLKLHD